MGLLIAVEGIDGAGKRTLTAGLADEWRAAGLTVGSLAFPRYGRSVHADLGAEALRGEHGDLRASVHAMALMWALDRRDALEELRDSMADHDVVLLDRYVASNAAYGAARLSEGADGPFARWVDALEFSRFALPRPDVQVLLGVPVELARRRARLRAASEPGRGTDAYESDPSLQERVAAVYEGLAARGWGSRWDTVRVNDSGAATIPDPGALASGLVRACR